MSIVRGLIATLPILLGGLAIVAVPANATAENGAGSPSEQSPAPQVVAPFDGVWEGKIFFDKEAFLAPTSTPAEGTDFRIEISGPVVRVFVKEAQGFQESKPGAFHIAPVETNAVIFASDSAPEAWVESWTFAVAQKDADTLIVEYSRIVENRSAAIDARERTFATRGFGEFKRAVP